MLSCYPGRWVATISAEMKPTAMSTLQAAPEARTLTSIARQVAQLFHGSGRRQWCLQPVSHCQLHLHGETVLEALHHGCKPMLSSCQTARLNSVAYKCLNSNCESLHSKKCSGIMNEMLGRLMKTFRSSSYPLASLCILD